MSRRPIITLAAFFGATAVAAGAFGAHALSDFLGSARDLGDGGPLPVAPRGRAFGAGCCGWPSRKPVDAKALGGRGRDLLGLALRALPTRHCGSRSRHPDRWGRSDRGLDLARGRQRQLTPIAPTLVTWP